MAASLPPALFIGKVKLPDRSLFEQQILTLASAAKRSSVYKERESTAALRVLTARYIVEGLYHVFASLNSGLSLSISHTQRAYAADARLSIFSYRMMVDVTDAIVKLGWAKVSKGYVRNDDSHVLSTYKATGDLLQAFEKCGIVWQRLVHRKNEKTIFLRCKSKVKELANGVYETVERLIVLPTPNTAEVRAMKANLKRINDHVSRQAICLHLSNDSMRGLSKQIGSKNNQTVSFFGEPRKKARHINFYDVLQYRVFSNGSMEQGGRFYGGWWQNIPSKYRAFITINGARTDEIDFSEFHIRLLYARAGMTPPLGDLYDFGNRLPGYPAYDPKVDPYKSVRAVHKAFLNAYLNDPHNRHRLTKREMGILWLTTAQLVECMLSKHPLLKSSQGEGLSLQYLDAQIAESVMMQLLDQNITCLPIHDSFIVDSMHTQKLVEAMNHAYQQFVPGLPKFKFESARVRSEFILPFNAAGNVDLDAMVAMHRNSFHNRYVEDRSGSAKLNRQNKCNIGVLRHGIVAVAGDRHEQIIRAAYTPRV